MTQGSNYNINISTAVFDNDVVALEHTELCDPNQLNGARF
jgi:hypothetical protein